MATTGCYTSPRAQRPRAPNGDGWATAGGPSVASGRGGCARSMIPILALGPFAVATHDAFTVLGARRRPGHLLPRAAAPRLARAAHRLDLARGRPGRRDRRPADHRLGAPRVLHRPRRRAAERAIEHSGKSLIGALAGGYLAIVLAKRAFGYTALDRRCLRAGDPGRHGHRARSAASCPSCRSGTPTDLPWGVSVSAEAAAAFARCPGLRRCPMHPRCCTRSRSTSSPSS